MKFTSYLAFNTYISAGGLTIKNQIEKNIHHLKYLIKAVGIKEVAWYRPQCNQLLRGIDLMCNSNTIGYKTNRKNIQGNI